MNKFNETIEAMNEMGAKNYENMRKLGEMQINTFNKMFEKQVEVFNLVMNTAISQVELASEAKDYQDALRGQITLGQKLAEELVEKTRETAEFAQQTGETYRAWAEEIVKETAEKANEAVKQAA
jgi:phasin family protein